MSQILTEQDVLRGLEGSDLAWAYNGLDCCITAGVQPVLEYQLQQHPRRMTTYRYEMSCQAAALTMMLRGCAFDPFAAKRGIKDWEAEETRLIEATNQIIADVWVKTEQRKGSCSDNKPHRWSNSVVVWRKHCQELVLPDDTVAPPHTDAQCVKCGASRLVPGFFNPLSSPQVIKLLYEVLKLPKQFSRNKEHSITANDEALDKVIHLKRTTDEQATIIRAILDVRKAHKQISFLRSRRSCDGRLRQSVNVGATEVGRWSASKDPFREGTNFQNIADRSRNVLIADPGLWIGYADLEQAESKIVAYDSEDQGYIDAHNAGDVHTFVARMVWPELEWTGDPKLDRKIAESPTAWDKDHGYRDYAKHVQHGGNIGQTPFGMARDAHIPVKAAEEVYERMYGVAFPSVRRRQQEIMAAVQHTGVLVSPLERERQFFGRLWEPATQREGMAQTQQSTVADVINLAINRVYREFDTAPNLLNAPRLSDPNKVWLLAQIHDAILFLIRPHDITTLNRVLELMTIPIKIRGQVCTIGVDVALGTNFRHFNPKKPETVGGISSWHLQDDKIIIHNTKDYLEPAR